MRLPELILYRISKSWPDYMKKRRENLGCDSTDRTYHVNYALIQQYDEKVRLGVKYKFRGKEILEIGCGHGGISIFLAVNGAKRVVGIDLNAQNLAVAADVKKMVMERLNISEAFPVEFLEMNAYEMEFAPGSFDIVLAENVFEHFMEPEKVMQQSYTVLRKDGQLIVPVFSSIWSRNALHLKNSLKVPWANLFFSEKTIIAVVNRLCRENPSLIPIYPGVAHNPQRVRDLRKYKDLNDITYGEFKRMAKRTGFVIEYFGTKPSPPKVGKIVRRIPILREGVLADIFSVGAEAVLRKV